MPIGPQSVVGAVLDERPETMAIFLRHRMHCPGCVMAPFVTLAEAAASYRVDPDALIAELRAAAAGREPEGAL